LEGREGVQDRWTRRTEGQDRKAEDGNPFTLGWPAERDRLIEDVLALTTKLSST
jgi:hypothetical protein